MGTVDGTLLLHEGESSVLVEIDFSERHEIADGGQTITGTPTVAVLLDGSISTGLSVASIVLNGTSKIVQFRVTVVSAVAGEDYELKCTVVLSGGATLVECLEVNMEPC